MRIKEETSIGERVERPKVHLDLLDIREDIQPISVLQQHAARLVDQVRQTHRPVVILQRGHVAAVLLDADDYQALKDAAMHHK